MFGLLYHYAHPTVDSTVDSIPVHWNSVRKCGFLSSTTCFEQNIDLGEHYNEKTGRMVQIEIEIYSLLLNRC